MAMDVSKLTGNPEFTKEVLAAADKYQLEKLKDICEDKLCENIKLEDALDLLVVGDRFRVSKLKEEALNLIVKHKKKVTGLDEWVLFVKTYPELCVEITKLL